MSQDSILKILAAAFVLGLFGGSALYWKIKPTEEQKIQLRMNWAIQSEICVRLKQDLEKFKGTPNSFKRTSLRVLIGEARATAKALLHDLPDEYAIRFAGSPETMFSECQSAAKQWVRIATTFPEFYEEEKALVERSEPKAIVLPRMLPEIPVGAVASRERRVALVLGNASYEARPLKNPINDAKDVAQFLRSVGFSVVEVLNADTKGMEGAIQKFVNDLEKDDVGLLYYSGHGIEFRGRNYLLPVNANIQNEEDIPRQGFDANTILEKTGHRNAGAIILVIDACRNAPVYSKFRSAKVGLDAMSAPRGSIVAFSAGPGQLAGDGNGRNSPYTLALLKAAQIPNRRIEDVLKETSKAVGDESGGRQVPWYTSSLIGDFYFSADPKKR